MLREFKEFLEKFKVIPVAIAFILATGFVPVVEAITKVLTQLIAAVGIKGLDSDNAPMLNEVPIPIGAAVSAIVGFVILALVVFMMVKSLNRAGAETGGGPTPDQELLTEIRDLLRQQSR